MTLSEEAVAKMLQLLDVFGWAGGLMIASAYMLVSIERIPAGSRVFQLLNTVGALMLGAACFSEASWQPAALNALWFVFGVRALVTGHLRTRRGDLAS
ncbi:MAG: hypothetical protein WA991_07950 [Ornithinimicrobium sp.]